MIILKEPLIIIVGPTAVGKTDISIEVAKKLNGEIISADSMQIYKYLDIGSAKPNKEEMNGVNHYMIDEIDPRDDFSVSDYQKMAKEYIKEIISKDKIPIIAGGTGLYVNSLIYNMNFSNTSSDTSLRDELNKEYEEKGKEYLYKKLEEVDSKAASRIHPNNIKRVIRALEVFYSTGRTIKDFSNDMMESHDYNYILIGLRRDRRELYERINKRVDIMFDMGLIDEVRNLVEMGLTEEDISMKGIGYKEIIAYLNGEYDIEKAREIIKRNSRRYAKRQLTWFKRYDKIKWFDITENNNRNELIKMILKFIEGIMNFT